MKPNALVAQSGGPSPVINASLQGVIEECFDRPDTIGTVLAGWHGIEGVLQEELIDISKQPMVEIRLLKTTPAAGAIGTCRYKLKDETSEDYNRIIDVFQAHNIGYFFYIGGNDSMDTAQKVSALAANRGFDLAVAGVPKTIDNDIGDSEFKIIDHTPGYGSAAKYWTHVVQNVEEENRGMSVSEPVAVLQAMGRKTGWIPAAARLADPDREMPLQLYLAEANHSLQSLLENVRSALSRHGRCIVVVSEGFDAGSVGEAHDGFGHIEYGASRSTVAQIVTNFLNDSGLNVRGQATGQVPGVLQRSTSMYSSKVDMEEAYLVGRKAVSVAVEEGTGWMATILREPGADYRPFYHRVPLGDVANTVRQIPAEWISENGLDVTDDFVRYARPLIGEEWPNIKLVDGRQRFARFNISFIEKKLPTYTPTQFRGT